jgi:hypothetical protein
MASTVSYDLNFGAGSRLDSTVFGACRPGGAGEEEPTAPGSIPDEAVSAWAAAVKEKGVSRVVSLLDTTELSAYQTPLEQQYAKLFTRCAVAVGEALHVVDAPLVRAGTTWSACRTTQQSLLSLTHAS